MPEAFRSSSDESLLDRLFGTVEELHLKSVIFENSISPYSRFEPAPAPLMTQAEIDYVNETSQSEDWGIEEQST